MQVKIYRYFIFLDEAERQVTHRPRRMGTLEAIHAVGGIPLVTTETLADASALDAQGFTAETEAME